MSIRRSVSARINGLTEDGNIDNILSKNLSDIYVCIYIYIYIYIYIRNDKSETSKYFNCLQSNLLFEFSTNIDTQGFDVCDMEKKNLN